MNDKREVVESSRVWEQLGNHGGRLNALESAKLQNEQSIINVRAELNGHVKGIEDKFDTAIRELNRDIKQSTEIILRKISNLAKFKVIIIAGGTVVGSMVLGLFACAAWIITNLNEIKAVFQ